MNIQLKNFINNFRINYNGKINSTRIEMLNDSLSIKIEFITSDAQTITKEIIIKLTPKINNTK